jgi:outer membrane protein OmpA-like peptidoglycan-associated protein
MWHPQFEFTALMKRKTIAICLGPVLAAMIASCSFFPSSHRPVPEPDTVADSSEPSQPASPHRKRRVTTEEKPASVVWADPRAAATRAEIERQRMLTTVGGEVVTTGLGDCVHSGAWVFADGDDCFADKTDGSVEDEGNLDRLAGRPTEDGLGDSPRSRPSRTAVSESAVASPVSSSAASQSPQPPRLRPAAAEIGSSTPPVLETPPSDDRFVLSSDMLFGFGRTNLDGLGASARDKLAELATQIKQRQAAGALQVRIIGHADRLGSRKANIRISEARARSIKAYLVAQGVDARLLKAHGVGSAQPVVSCTGTRRTAGLVACLQPNRRVEVKMMDLKSR